MINIRYSKSKQILPETLCTYKVDHDQRQNLIPANSRPTQQEVMSS